MTTRTHASHRGLPLTSHGSTLYILSFRSSPQGRGVKTIYFYSTTAAAAKKAAADTLRTEYSNAVLVGVRKATSADKGTKSNPLPKKTSKGVQPIKKALRRVGSMLGNLGAKKFTTKTGKFSVTWDKRAVYVSKSYSDSGSRAYPSIAAAKSAFTRITSAGKAKAFLERNLSAHSKKARNNPATSRIRRSLRNGTGNTAYRMLDSSGAFICDYKGSSVEQALFQFNLHRKLSKSKLRKAVKAVRVNGTQRVKRNPIKSSSAAKRYARYYTKSKKVGTDFVVQQTEIMLKVKWRGNGFAVHHYATVDGSDKAYFKLKSVRACKAFFSRNK